MSIEQKFLSLAYSSIDMDDPLRNDLVGHCSDNTDNLADYVKEVLSYVEIFEDMVEAQIYYLDPDADEIEEKKRWLLNLVDESRTVCLSELAKMAVEDWFENYDGSHKPV